MSLGSILGICFLLSLINIGPSIAFNTIIFLTAVALDISYVIPIFLLLKRRLAGKHPQYGPFKLGAGVFPSTCSL